MTLSPSVSARGVEGKRAERNPLCAVPGCLSLSQHGHHIWPRSYLRGQPYEWVRVEEKVVSNTTGLCARHHAMVTGGIGGHKARIEYVSGSFLWYDLVHKEKSGMLFPQPEGVEPPAEGPPEIPKAHRHVDLEEGETCARCGYTKPMRTKPGPKRPAKTWTVTVPDDAEIGADVLDGWVEDFAAVLGLNPASPRLLRYHVLALVLAWAQQNMPTLIADVREVAPSAVNGKMLLPDKEAFVSETETPTPTPVPSEPSEPAPPEEGDGDEE